MSFWNKSGTIVNYEGIIRILTLHAEAKELPIEWSIVQSSTRFGKRLIGQIMVNGQQVISHVDLQEVDGHFAESLQEAAVKIMEQLGDIYRKAINAEPILPKHILENLEQGSNAYHWMKIAEADRYLGLTDDLGSSMNAVNQLSQARQGTFISSFAVGMGGDHVRW